MENDYIIDFDLFSTIEVVKIIKFFELIEQTKVKKIKPNVLITQYREYQNILKNKALEKKYDKMLYERSKVSIYEVMKQYLNK